MSQERLTQRGRDQIVDRTDLTKMVYKLGTVGIDNAVTRGGSLLLNRDLLRALVSYRQVVGHLNQSIDSAMALQANPELWLAGPPKALVNRMIDLTDAIHLFAIGDDAMGQANAWFGVLQAELSKERRTRVLPIIWILTGINLLPLKLMQRQLLDKVIKRIPGGRVAE